MRVRLTHTSNGWASSNETDKMIEINTIEEILALCEAEQCHVIIGRDWKDGKWGGDPFIEIYDDYRE